MAETFTLTFWELLSAVVIMYGAGLLTGATLFYSLGRRHGMDVMAAAWRKSMRDDWAMFQKRLGRDYGDEPTEHL